MEHYYRDHLGNDYSSLRDMCKAYNLTVDEFNRRRHLGLVLKDCLTMSERKVELYGHYKESYMVGKPCKDHLGAEYSSEEVMCKTHNVPLQMYKDKLALGFSLEEALTPSKGIPLRYVRVYSDHLGNTYPTAVDLCNAYNTVTVILDRRLQKGWSLEKALTAPVNLGNAVDHTNKKYPSHEEMCKAWGIPYLVYLQRIMRSWGTENALTVPEGDAKPSSTCIKDHLGVEYSSIKDLCKAWGLTVNVFNHRRDQGWDMKKILTTPSSPKVRRSDSEIYSDVGCILASDDSNNISCKDHLGNVYNSLTDMLDAWGVKRKVFRRRIDDGWTLKNALTIPLGVTKGGVCTDHLGNIYSSKQEMCDAYGVLNMTFWRRMDSGWTLEAALTTSDGRSKGSRAVSCEDHLGNKYPSRKEMCLAWGIDDRTVTTRLRLGWTLEEALTTSGDRSKGSRAVSCKDHLGNEYPSKQEMCLAWNINDRTFANRLRLGWTLEEALTTPITKTRTKRVKQKHVVCKDHLGKKYTSVMDMCKDWGIPVGAYRNRRSKGWDLEKALSEPYRGVVYKDAEADELLTNTRYYIDHLGNTFSTSEEMCQFYGKEASDVAGKLLLGFTLEEALTEDTEKTEDNSKK